MTEAQWRASDNPEAMLEQLRGASARKLRLFAVACCRRVERLMTDPECRRAVDVAERFADGQATERDLAQARAASRNRGGNAHDAATNATSSSAWGAAAAVSDDAALAAAWADGVYVEGDFVAERKAQTHSLRDIFGNPFRPLPSRPTAIAPLAEEVYAGKWDLLPILGEWLQENGFWQAWEHCLDPHQPHVKGCWVVDWLTARE